MKIGIYEHYKGLLFLVLGEATLEGESLEPVIIYQALYDDYRIWVRTKEDFMMEVSIPEYDYRGTRFRFIREWTKEDALLYPKVNSLLN
jgi:hypothetical protein